MSDLHVEFDKDWGRSFAHSLDPTNVDVLVLAGDIIPLKFYQNAENFFSIICSKFKHVIYTWGNHSFYDGSLAICKESTDKLQNKFPNLHHLENSQVTIDGQTFIGGTGWFPYLYDNDHYKQYMNDFWLIQGFEPYKWNANFNNHLETYLESDHIVVMHHLPSMKCVHPMFARSSLNRFFVNSIDDLILERKPKMVVYGHTHIGKDFILGDTRLICNPRGYPKEAAAYKKDGWKFNPKMIIEV